MHQTKLHIEWREQDLVCQPGFIIIPPAQLEALDDALFLLVKKFLPISFYSSLEQKHSAVKHRRISVLGLIATVFGEDQSLPELTAVADRQTFEDMLSIPWLPRETASEFRSRHERNVAAYNQFSEVPRFSNTDSGVKEHTEYIILRLRKGPLKNMVTAEWDLQKLKAVSKSRSQPALPELRELIEFQYKVLEIKEARELSLQPAKVDEKTGKRKFHDGGGEHRAHQCAHGSNQRFVDGSSLAIAIKVQPVATCTAHLQLFGNRSSPRQGMAKAIRKARAKARASQAKSERG